MIIKPTPVKKIEKVEVKPIINENLSPKITVKPVIPSSNTIEPKSKSPPPIPIPQVPPTQIIRKIS